jgi:hypothetical protein
VISDITPPVREDDLDPFLLKGSLGGEDVLHLPRFSHGDDRRMLQNQKDIFHLTRGASLDQTVLQAEGIFIFDHPQPKGLATTKVFFNYGHGLKLPPQRKEVKMV